MSYTVFTSKCVVFFETIKREIKIKPTVGGKSMENSKICESNYSFIFAKSPRVKKIFFMRVTGPVFFFLTFFLMMSREGRGKEGEGMSKMMDQWLQKAKPGDNGLTRPPASGAGGLFRFTR